jgi:hypothetical protein
MATKSQNQDNDRYTNSWTISFNTFSGNAPNWYSNSYPFYGNKNQASYTKNIDITDNNVLTQGPGMASLDDSESPALATLIKGISKSPATSGVAFAVGGNTLYKFSSTAITDDASFPHTIDKATVTAELGEDVCYYDGKLYYFYNHSGDAGDIGQYDMSTTFNDDWGSTFPSTGADLENATHQAIVGGDDVMYFTNGEYIGYYDHFEDVFENQGLDFASDSECVAISWNGDRLYIANNRPNVSGSTYNQSAVYSWNGISSSWDDNPIEVSGKIGALYTKNGVTFIWWNDGTTNVFGYIDGLRLVPLKRFSGTLPVFYQVGEYEGFIIWFTGGLVYMWGAGDIDVPTTMFQYTGSTGTVSGGIASTFGKILLSSENTAGTSWYFEQESGYQTDCEYRTIAFDVSSPNTTSYIDSIIIETDQLSTGAKCDFTLQYNFGKTSSNLNQIAYSTNNTTRHKILNRSLETENFRLDIKWANGSATNPVKIRAIWIQGRSNKHN